MKNNNTKRKKRKKSSAASKLFFLMLFVIIVLVGAIFAVKFNTPHTKSIQVHTKIINNGTVILDYPITVTGENPTAAKAFEIGCDQKNISYKLENGMFDGFANVYSTDSEGWLFYVNGTIASVGAQEYAVNENDTVEFRYANYSTEFLASYQSSVSDTNSVPVKIKIYAQSDDVSVDSSEEKPLIESTVSAKENSTAETAFKDFCEFNNAQYTIESGTLTSYGDFKNTKTSKWMFYMNGNKFEDTLDLCEINPGDVLEFKYETAE